MTLATGTKLGRYEIRAKIGEGGMGEVYLAQDTKLDRKVALKILPAEVATDRSRMSRFVQEAKAVSALNHPNIITIYEIDATDSAHLIATEFIDGETLRQRMANASMPLSEAIDVTIQIATALNGAHQAGIIHRDIKPENVMVRADGLVKVLDFGLAKLTKAETSDPDAATRIHSDTQPGMIMGTVAYMSPEQARGQAIDPRTDIWSLGVVLYEMLSGRQPFRGETASDTLANILHREPDELIIAALPSDVMKIIERMLARSLEARYATMADAVADLKRLQRRTEFESEHQQTSLRNSPIVAQTRVAAGQSESSDKVSSIGHSPSIAVLPFVNMSADPENEYFCDGLAEELLNALAKIDELRVAARTSAFSFKGKHANVSEIGNALNVSTVLEGSVRKSGNRVRITTQLVNATDGYHLWSERYDREMNDIFDVQDEITVAVIEALKVKLFGQDRAAVLKRHTRNPEAYEFYLRGRSYSNRFTPQDFEKAIESFQRAIAIDPAYAWPYAALAEACTEMSFFSFAPSESMPQARDAVQKALALDDTLGEAHNSLAIIKMYYDWDYAGAEREFKRAIALNPGSAPIHNWYGWYLGLMGRFDESLKELQHAQELDPLSEVINTAIGIVLHWSREPERAIAQFQKVLELNSNYVLALSFLAEAYQQKGDFVSAIAAVDRLQHTANDPLTLPIVAYVHARSGDRNKALEILSELEKRSGREYVPALNLAQVYAGLSDTEQAVAWLEKACNERSVWMAFLKVDLKFDPLRSDARFQQILRRVGLTNI